MSTLLSDRNVEQLNSLLRGELSAVESYEEALTHLEDELIEEELQRIANEHWGTIEALREYVIEYGGEPSWGSGPWGFFTALITGAAKLLGPKMMLSALKKGEEHGVQLYEEAMNQQELADECRIVIASRLLPLTRTHVQTLDRLLAHFN